MKNYKKLLFIGSIVILLFLFNCSGKLHIPTSPQTEENVSLSYSGKNTMTGSNKAEPDLNVSYNYVKNSALIVNSENHNYFEIYDNDTYDWSYSEGVKIHIYGKGVGVYTNSQCYIQRRGNLFFYYGSYYYDWHNQTTMTLTITKWDFNEIEGTYSGFIKGIVDYDVISDSFITNEYHVTGKIILKNLIVKTEIF